MVAQAGIAGCLLATGVLRLATPARAKVFSLSSGTSEGLGQKSCPEDYSGAGPGALRWGPKCLLKFSFFSLLFWALLGHVFKNERLKALILGYSVCNFRAFLHRKTHARHPL